MALPKALFTVADLSALPASERGERYELIDGVLEVNAAPGSDHQSISNNLEFLLTAHVRANRLGRVRDNSGVQIGERVFLIPDVVFISQERLGIIGAENIEAAPDLVVEILSPSTRSYDLLTKRAVYARIGVREYWIVDAEARAVTVLALEGGRYAGVAPVETGVVTSRVLPGLRLTVAEVFEDVGAVEQPGAGGEEG
ncbi:MAG: Uma2 family endonuclease [Thermomicrobiales bacterium]